MNFFATWYTIFSSFHLRSLSSVFQATPITCYETSVWERDKEVSFWLFIMWLLVTLNFLVRLLFFPYSLSDTEEPAEANHSFGNSFEGT